MATNDELAQTATAPATPSGSLSEITAPRGPMLGRFRLDAILGQGGMGIVHAAFDLELERRVALKVLHKAGSFDARARLLREARAMAKLSHPNVIRVFDVGSVDGQDFVAMELVDGETLGDWLRRARRDPRAIVAAFVAAGHGLGAAHTAGLVHRDFKPSNVLRSRTGEIVVTDFGLARTAEIHDGPASDPSGDPSPITHTQTGAILGTPAYMAPEQWTAGTISPATDQYAFCVALWEGLAGDRPYRGATIDELRTAVLAGMPSGIDRIPRPLRPILRRGLAIDAAQRWPSMAALLTALERTARRRKRWIVGGVLGLGGAAVMVIAALRSNAPAIDDCSPSALDPDAVWSAPRAFAVAGRDPEVAGLVESDLAAWRTIRSRTCAAPLDKRMAKLGCLDASLARLDDVVGAALAEREPIGTDDVALELVDPAICDSAIPPRLMLLTRELAAGFRITRRSHQVDSPVTPEDRALADHTSACGLALQELAQIGSPIFWALGGSDHNLDTLRGLGERCDDDKLRATIAIRDAVANNDPDRADAAVARFPEAELRAELALTRAVHAGQANQTMALTEYRQAIDLFGARRLVHSQLQMVLNLARVLLVSGRPEDLTELRALAKRWLPITHGDDRNELDTRLQELRWHLGEVAAADADLDALDASPGPSTTGTFRNDEMIGVTGDVVDEAGVPIADATVASGAPLLGDSATPATRLFTVGRRTTRTARDGTFTLMFAHGTVVAQSGELRSDPIGVASHVHLVLRLTGHIEGTVTLGTTPASRVWVIAHPAIAGAASKAIVLAPVRADGSFRIDGIPRGPLVIGAVENGGVGVGARPQRVTVGRETLTGITLALTPKLYVIGRSSDLVAPENAMIVAYSRFDPGPELTFKALIKQTLDTDVAQLGNAEKVDLKHVPPEFAAKVRADDVIATIAARPEGALVVCGLGFAKQQVDPVKPSTAFGKGIVKEKFACMHVGADEPLVVLPLPQLKKFDAK